jgi:hypothetical protein
MFGLVSGCTSQAQRRFAQYEPVARDCISALEGMRSFNQSDVGSQKWNSAIEALKKSVDRMTSEFKDESTRGSYQGIVEAARIYSGARTNAQLAANGGVPDNVQEGESVGTAYMQQVEQDNALPLAAMKAASAKVALDNEKDSP